jgi:hypothetical protein
MENGGQSWRIWWLRSGDAYALFVFVCVALLLWRRRKATAIYNLDTKRIDDLLVSTFDQMGLSWSKPQSKYVIAGTCVNGDRVHIGAARQDLMLEVERNPWLSHVTLFWSRARDSVRARVENVLTGRLQSAHFQRTCSTNRLMVIAAGLFVLLFAISVTYQVARFFEQRL